MQPVEDRASEVGDTVTINARGKEVDGADPEEIKVDDIEVVLGGEHVQKEFTENLTGVKPDDKKTFTVEYPADFSTPGLAGKKRIRNRSHCRAASRTSRRRRRMGQEHRRRV